MEIWQHWTEVGEERGMKHPWMKLWYGGKEILIKKEFDLTHKENIEKNKEALR